MFVDQLSEGDQTPLKAKDFSSDDSEEELEKSRKGAPSALDMLHKGLKTKRFKN